MMSQLIRSRTLRLPGPGELDDGVPAPGLDPVLGGGLQHPGAGVGPGVGVVISAPAPVLPLPPPELVTTDVTPPVSLMITLLMMVTTGPMSPCLPLTLSISPRSVSPPVSVSVVATVPPAALGLDLLEEEAETAEEETQPHDVRVSQSGYIEH